MFMKYLIHFVVADDQVSLDDLTFLHAPKGLQSIRVVECPKFRQLCMFLHETLVDNDIPRRTRMREGVITQWQESFERLKLDLSVGVGIFSFCFINCLCHRNPSVVAAPAKSRLKPLAKPVATISQAVPSH